MTAYNIRVNTTNNVVTAVPVTLGLPASYVQPYVVPQPLASAGATLFYFIRGLDPGGPGPVPATIALNLPPNPPTPVAASPSSSAVTISWTGNIPSEAVTFYTVYRSINPTSGFVSIGFTNSPATIYKDASAAAGTDYYYQVSATNPGGGTGIPGGESLLSSAVTTALLPSTPIGLTAALNSLSDNVTLTWTSQSGSEPNLQNYILTRTINGGAPTIPSNRRGVGHQLRGFGHYHGQRGTDHFVLSPGHQRYWRIQRPGRPGRPSGPAQSAGNPDSERFLELHHPELDA